MQNQRVPGIAYTRFQAETAQDRENLRMLDNDIKSLSDKHNDIYRELRNCTAERERIQAQIAKKCVLINGGHFRQRHPVPYGHNEHDYDPCAYCGWDD